MNRTHVYYEIDEFKIYLLFHANHIKNSRKKYFDITANRNFQISEIFDDIYYQLSVIELLIYHDLP